MNHPTATQLLADLDRIREVINDEILDNNADSVPVAYIVGVKEIATELQVTPQAVSNWEQRRRTTGFPQPLKRLASGPVYDARAIYRWHRNYVPATGGAPTGNANNKEGKNQHG